MACYTSIAACLRAPGAVVMVPIIVQGGPPGGGDGGVTSFISTKF